MAGMIFTPESSGTSCEREQPPAPITPAMPQSITIDFFIVKFAVNIAKQNKYTSFQLIGQTFASIFVIRFIESEREILPPEPDQNRRNGCERGIE